VLEFCRTCPTCQKKKTGSIGATSMVPCDAGLAARRYQPKNNGSGPYTSEVPGGSVGSARRKRCNRSFGGCVTPGGVRCPSGGLEPGSA